jgi:hypothetical protein
LRGRQANVWFAAGNQRLVSPEAVQKITAPRKQHNSIQLRQPYSTLRVHDGRFHDAVGTKLLEISAGSRFCTGWTHDGRSVINLEGAGIAFLMDRRSQLQHHRHGSRTNSDITRAQAFDLSRGICQADGIDLYRSNITFLIEIDLTLKA